jgi:hypothetical protein
MGAPLHLPEGKDDSWQAQLFKQTCNLSLFLIVLTLALAQYHSQKGAILLFCKFEIFSEEIAGNGAI